MKTLILLAAIAFLVPTTFPVCAADHKTLVITLRDGVTQAFPLAEKLKIVFSEEKFTVCTNTQSTSYDLTSVRRFRVTESTPIKADVNADGAVDVADIATIISVMAASTDGPQEEGLDPAQADVNADGTVDVADISAVISVMAAGTP